MDETILRAEPDSTVSASAPSRGKSTRNPAGRFERAGVTCAVAGLLMLCALQGGSYDAIGRGEAGVAIWWTLLLGLSLGVLPRRRPRREAWFVLGALAVMLLWTALALSWSESEERTSLELARELQYAGVLVLTASVLRSSTVGPAVSGAAMAGIGICVLALASRLWPDAFPRDRVAQAFSTTRLSYPLNYWNGVAAWGSMATAMALVWSAHARTAIFRALALAAVPVCVTVVYLTYSRAGVAGVTIGVLASVALARTRAVLLVHVATAAAASFVSIHAVRRAAPIADATGSGGRGDVLLALAIGATLCAAVAIALHALEADERLRFPRHIGRPMLAATTALAVAAGAVVLTPVAKRGLDQFKNNSVVLENKANPAKRLTSASGNRHNLWTSALAAFRSEPVKGIGPGTFEFWWNRDKVDPEHVRDAHSLYIESLAESGIVGLLAVLGLCGALLAALVRFRARAKGRSQTGAAAAALAGFVVWLFHAGVDWMWEETAVTTLALVLGAAGCAAAQRRRSQPSLGLRAAGGVLAAVLILVQLPTLVGTSETRRSDAALARGDVTEARQAAARAVAAWPYAATPYAARARAEEADGRLFAARHDADLARRREPTNWRHPLLEARIASELGNVKQAIHAYAEAVRLRPLGSMFR